MLTPPPEARRLAKLAAAGLGLVLLVILVSAAIRLGPGATPPLAAAAMTALRAVQRTAASLEVLVVLAFGWTAWRARRDDPALARGASLAATLAVFLSVLGLLAGQNPPHWAALGNVLGGLALAAVFAWLLSHLRGRAAQAGPLLASLAAALFAVQCLLGARLAIFPGAASSPALPAHAMLGIALAGAAVWLARRAAGGALFALAFLTPLAGFTALQLELSFVAALAHAFAAALLVVVTAYACARLA